MANLDAIVRELQQERDRLDAAINALTSIGGSAPRSRTGRTVSAAVRAKIAAAQRARWAKQRSASTPKSTAPERRISATGLANIRAAQKARRAREQGQKVVSIAPKRHISAARLARIRAAARARWAKVKAGKK